MDIYSLTKEIVRELLDYDPETGKLTWRKRDRKWFKTDRDCNAWNARFAVTQAFGSIRVGYFCGDILDKKYLAHRVIWFWMTGEWPKEQIDHINHDRKDNKWLNLLEVSHRDNTRNQSRHKDNSSGYTGVCWHKQHRKWVVRIRHIHLGWFDSLRRYYSC